ncbi:MAG: hypothetical protein M1833_000508 [Piccolia ochrophora]|nr:MAG: hypothetical protein M1833_000508 [Piccolia ochrophora]
MSLQTRVLVDGVWTTRNVDLQTVLERNREHKTKKPMDTPEMGPTMGLLTKTIVQSPVCIWILPARIRHKTKNDVLFIGVRLLRRSIRLILSESSVQIKELHPNGHLQEVATKIDFPARITNARIIGQPRKIPLSHLDSYLKKEDTTEDADPFHSEDNFNPEFYLVEDRDSIFPPQILVLALDSGEILFIFAFENANGTVGFSIATKPLFQQHSDVDTPAHVAVDPREDGLLFFIAIDKNDTYLVKSVAPCGSLRGCVNKAFAVLDIELNQSDLLIVGGDMSAGGLYMIPPKQREVECVEAIPDWTPMLDFASVHRLPGELAKTNDFNDPSTVSASIHRDRIFACTGQGEHGSISEIRHGFEGRIGLILDYQAGINQIWSFANQQTRGIYLLCSLPLLTEVLYVSADLRTVEQKGAADVEGLDLDSRTLMATSFGDAVVQVTGHSIRATLGILNAEQPRSTHCFLKCSPDESIIYASLHESTLSILTIVQSAERFRLHLAQLQRETGKLSIAEVGSPVILASSPSSLFAAQIGGNLYAFVGDSECNMQIHYCDARDGPQLHCTQSRLLILHMFNDAHDSQGVKNNPYDDTFAICESATVLRCKSSENIQAMSLVCGLRNGTMTTFDLHLANSTGEIHLSDQTTYQVGDTSVQILDDRVNEDAAFVICGQYLFRLIFEPDATVRHLIKDIWLTDRNERLHKYPSVTIIAAQNLGDF